MTIARSFYTTDTYAEHYLGIRWPVAIWAAVLKQAIGDIVTGPAEWELRGLDLNAQRKLALEIRAAAEHWVEDEGEDPRRFRWVCYQLNLEPEAVRREIVQKLEQAWVG